MRPGVAQAYRILEETAFNSLPCPTNPELAKKLGVRSIATASDYVKDLEDRGLIKVKRTSNTRSIEIVATGKAIDSYRTSEVKPRKREMNTVKQVRAMSRDDIANRVVDNRVCPSCGVRATAHAEFGCGRDM